MESTVACFIRAPGGSIGQNDLKVQYVDDTEAGFQAGEAEELVSNIINVESCSGDYIKFHVSLF